MQRLELFKAKVSLERIERFERALFAALLLIVWLLPYPELAPSKGHNGFLSSHGLTLAAHLSPERHLLMYNRIVVDSAGVDHYEAYNRFSVVPFLLIRGAMELGGDDLFAQVTAARKLMLLFWLGAMFCAYLAFKRLGRSSLVALTVVMLAFSTPFFLRYNDMVFNDVPALFGCMLLFHGLVVHWQENRPRQLLVKALVAVALGWQAYAMLFPAVALLQWKNRRTKENLLLAGAPLLLGVALLAFNLANECIATQTPLSETSTAKSISFRHGNAPDSSYASYAYALDQRAFAKEQLYRIGVSATPAILQQVLALLNKSLVPFSGKWLIWKTTAVHGILALAVVACALALAARRKEAFPPFCLLALALCWTLPMKHFTAFHDFQAIFLVGVPLILFDFLLGFLPSKSKIHPILATIFLASFVVAAVQICEDKISTQAESHSRIVELQAVTDSLRSESLPVILLADTAYKEIGGARHTLGFSLPQARFTDDERVAQWRLLDNPVRIERIVPLPAVVR